MASSRDNAPAGSKKKTLALSAIGLLALGALLVLARLPPHPREALDRAFDTSRAKFVGIRRSMLRDDSKSEANALPSEGEALRKRILQAFDGVPGHPDFGSFGSNGVMIVTSGELKGEAVGSSKSFRDELLGLRDLAEDKSGGESGRDG